MAEKETIREVFYGRDARLKLMEGVDRVANAVKVTMGAKGRNVTTSYGHTTKDGVTVARDIEIFDDAAQAKGAKLIKSAAVRTCDVVGDGTTQVCVLAQSIIKGGLRMLDEGKDAQDLKRELEEVKEPILQALRAQAKMTEDIEQIASISANDPKIGKIVSDAVKAVGADGLVTIENTYGENTVEVVEGMQIDKGVFLTSFFTDYERRRAEYEDISVMIFKGKLHDVVTLGKVLEPLAKEGKPILIIADDYETSALRMLELSRIQAGIQILPIKSPHIYHDEVLEDIAVYSGARVVTEADGLKNFKKEWFGHLKHLVANTERTIVRSDMDKLPAIEARVKGIYESAKELVESERRNVEKRAARLQGKMAIIKLSASVNEEGKELKDRVEDAVFASQAALEMGIIPGGGYSYLVASQEITRETDGARLLSGALQAPLRQIVKNAGKNDAEVSRKCALNKLGYNVVTEQFEDFFASGVVDPLKVALTAFENALSVAILALTTEVIISDKKVCSDHSGFTYSLSR